MLKGALTRLSALVVGASLLLSGCMLTHPGGTSLAYVEIEDVSLESAREATLKVFASEHYEVESSKPLSLVFVREGTVNDRLQYARYNESLEMCVEVTLEPYAENNVLVRADAFALPGGSSRSAVQVLRIARRPYMQLLRRVKAAAKATEKWGSE
jgi:hypothetical protein